MDEDAADDGTRNDDAGCKRVAAARRDMAEMAMDGIISSSPNATTRARGERLRFVYDRCAHTRTLMRRYVSC